MSYYRMRVGINEPDLSATAYADLHATDPWDAFEQARRSIASDLGEQPDQIQFDSYSIWERIEGGHLLLGSAIYELPERPR